MKEKNKNGCNIPMMTSTNLEKYVYSKKCLKQRRQPPHPSLQQSRDIFSPKSHLATVVILGRPAPIPNLGGCTSIGYFMGSWLFSHSHEKTEKQP